MSQLVAGRERRPGRPPGALCRASPLDAIGRCFASWSKGLLLRSLEQRAAASHPGAKGCCFASRGKGLLLRILEQRAAASHSGAKGCCFAFWGKGLLLHRWKQCIGAGVVHWFGPVPGDLWSPGAWASASLPPCLARSPAGPNGGGVAQALVAAFAEETDTEGKASSADAALLASPRWGRAVR